MSRNTVIQNKWKLHRKIGEGASGDVYKAVPINSRTDETVAVKVEKVFGSHSAIEEEYDTYRKIHSFDRSSVGIPKVFYLDKQNAYLMLVMEYLGKSLQSLFDDYGRRFSVKTVAMIGIQVLSRLQLVHSAGFIHQDIKPGNLLIGRDDPNRIYLIDFSLAKEFKCGKRGEHIKFRDGLPFVGTAHYASISAHQGHEAGRKDDLESLGYVLLYFLNGKVPWKHFCRRGLDTAARERRLREVERLKRGVDLEKMSEKMPLLQDYLKEVRSLEFEDEPNYGYLRSLFRDSLRDIGESDDRRFEWTEKAE